MPAKLFACFLAIAAALASLPEVSMAQTANLYTKPHTDAPGGIAGRVDKELTHAIALEHDRVSCYKAELSDGGKAFRFPGLPTGKYDLVLITKAGAVYEGLTLGGDADNVSGAKLKHLQERVTKADTFFNKAQIDRYGVIDGGDRLLAFVERLRDKVTLRQSGDVLDSNLRRFEVIEFDSATDDWQMMTSRHLYREEQPSGPGMPFLKHLCIPEVGNIRVVDTVKDLGTIPLPEIK